MPTVAEMIDAIRLRGKTLEEIAAALGVSEQAVYTWQSGRVKKPRREALEGINDLYASVVGAARHVTAPSSPADLAPPGELHSSTEEPSPRIFTRVPAESLHEEPLPDRHAVPPPRAPGEAFRFIHCADLHVDSPLSGLHGTDPRYASWIQLATRRAFARLVDMAIENGVAFVVIAGDLFDGEWKSADTGIFVSRQLARLTTAGIPVFAVAGNHDAASVVTRSVRWPENAHLLGGAPESIELHDFGAVIHGRSFGDRYESSDFVDGYPPARPGLFNLGILHTSLSGDAVHGSYAPCTPAALAARGYDYWALGHIHVPRVVQTAPHIVYSGNIQGRDVGETGPRGCNVVTVDAARQPMVHFVPLDDVRWERIPVAIDDVDARTVDDVVAAIVKVLEPRLPDGDRLLACRVVLTGATPLHGRLLSRRGSLKDEVATVLKTQLDGRICLEQLKVDTTDPDAVPVPDDLVPPRAAALLDEEFRRLRDLGSDALLQEEADLRKAFEDLSVLDLVHARRRDSIQEAGNWNALIDEARALLDGEFGDPSETGEEPA